jgi:hypothetical protein
MGGLGVFLGRAVDEGVVIGPSVYGAGGTLSMTAGHSDTHSLDLDIARILHTRFGGAAVADHTFVDDDHGVLDQSGLAVWSLWDGYLSEPSGVTLQTLLKGHGITLEHVHTSGHAAVSQLRELVDAMAPARVVPIHSEAGDRYEAVFPRGGTPPRRRMVGGLMRQDARARFNRDTAPRLAAQIGVPRPWKEPHDDTHSSRVDRRSRPADMDPYKRSLSRDQRIVD